MRWCIYIYIYIYVEREIEREREMYIIMYIYIYIYMYIILVRFTHGILCRNDLSLSGKGTRQKHDLGGFIRRFRVRNWAFIEKRLMETRKHLVAPPQPGNA